MFQFNILTTGQPFNNFKLNNTQLISVPNCVLIKNKIFTKCLKIAAATFSIHTGCTKNKFKLNKYIIHLMQIGNLKTSF